MPSLLLLVVLVNVLVSSLAVQLFWPFVCPLCSPLFFDFIFLYFLYLFSCLLHLFLCVDSPLEVIPLQSPTEALTQLLTASQTHRLLLLRRRQTQHLFQPTPPGRID